MYQGQINRWLSGTKEKNRPVVPKVHIVCSAPWNNCRTESKFGTYRTGGLRKLLMVLWKSSSSCGGTMGRGYRYSQKAADIGRKPRGYNPKDLHETKEKL